MALTSFKFSANKNKITSQDRKTLSYKSKPRVHEHSLQELASAETRGEAKDRSIDQWVYRMFNTATSTSCSFRIVEKFASETHFSQVIQVLF